MSKRTHSELIDARNYELDLAQAANNKLMQYAFSLRKLDKNMAILDQSIGKMRQHHKADVVTAHHKHGKTEGELRNQIAQARARLAQLEPQMAEAQKALDKDKKEEARIGRHIDGLKAKAAKLGEEAREASQHELDAQQAQQQVEHDIRFCEIENESLVNQLAEAKRLTAQAHTQSRQQDVEAREAEKELAGLQAKHKKEKRGLEVKLALAIKNSEELEDSLRREYKASLDQQVLQFEREEDARNNAERKKLKTEADELYAAHCDKIKEAQATNDKFRQEIVVLDLEKSKLDARIKADASKEVSQKRLKDALDDELSDISQKHSNARASEDYESSSLGNAIAIKKFEYDELMTVKNALAMEIKAYRLLLENEEDRLGEPPVAARVTKKRKVAEPEEEEEEEDADMEEEEEEDQDAIDKKAAQVATRTRSRRLTRSSSSRQ